MTEHTPSPQSVVVPVEPTGDMILAGAEVKGMVDVYGCVGNPDEVWSAMLAAAPAPSSLAGGWRSPTEVPEAKKGEHAYRIVAVKRADGEKVVTFSAFYMNAVPLWFEDDNESRKVTGWHSDSEGDDGPTYSPLLMGGDVLMGWREFPQWEAALSPEAPAREGVSRGAECKVGPDTKGDCSTRAGCDCPALTPRHEAPAEPCFECGSTERTGTACKPCNPEITDPNFGHEAPAEGPGERECLAVAIDPSLDGTDFSGLFAEGSRIGKALAAADRVLALRARSSAPEAREETLGNLLAVIHGDGGHRALEVGTKQAALEAEKIVANLLSSAPEAREGEAVGFVTPTGLDCLADGYSAPLRPMTAISGVTDATALYTHPAAPSADKLREALVSVSMAVQLGEAHDIALAALKADGGK